MEPATGSAAAGAVGLTALLVGALGPVGADVMIVVIAAIAGSTVSLAGDKSRTFWQVVKFMTIGVLVALVLSWALTGLLTSYIPSLAGPYAPSVIAMAIGFIADRLPTIFNGIANKFTRKLTKDN